MVREGGLMMVSNITQFSDNMMMMHSEVITDIRYDDIVMDICNSVDYRIKTLSIIIFVSWILGNWLYKKATLRRWFSNKPIIAIPWPAFNKKLYSVEETSMLMIILDILVPALRTITFIGMGLLIYYTQISGMN